MRVPINLASQPYENLRPLYSAVVLAVLLLVSLVLTIAWKERQNRNETRMLTQQSEQVDKGLADLRREQRELTVWLERPEVQEIRDRSAFLNALITRKSLSWTQMFMDLEKVLPDKVQVTAIKPRNAESAEAELRLTVASGTIPPLVEFLKNLEKAPQFAKPVVATQHFPAEKAQDPNITLELTVLYHQAVEGAASSAPAEGEGEQELPQNQPPAKTAETKSALPKDISVARVQKGAR